MADLTKQILEFTSKGLDGIAEADRAALLQASTKLAETLETPMEMMVRMFFVSFFVLCVSYSPMYPLEKSRW
jgi:hypothetical protein